MVWLAVSSFRLVSDTGSSFGNFKAPQLASLLDTYWDVPGWSEFSAPSCCHFGAEFSLALVAFVLLVYWRETAWRVVLFFAGIEGLS